MSVIRLLLLLFVSLLFHGLGSSQEVPVLNLSDFVSSEEIGEHMLRAADYAGEIDRESLFQQIDTFVSISEEPELRVAKERGHSVFLIEVQNASDGFGTWVFTSRRHSVNKFTIYDVTTQDTNVLIDSENRINNAKNIRRYIGYGAVLEFEPGESKTLAIYADIEVLRAVPFEFYAIDPYLDEYYWQTTRFAFFLPTIFTLICVNLLFFAFLGRPFFLYLAASELCLLLVALHAAAYLDAYGLAAFPVLAIQISELAKCGFIVFMTLFAMSFLNTQKEHPRFHIVLQALLIAGTILVLFWMLAGLVDKNTRVDVRIWTWVYAGGGSLIFPIIGVLAVVRFGAHFIPLVIGWSAVAFVGLYIFAYVLFQPLLGLPGIVTILAFIGWQEALFVTLSAIWKVWKDGQQQQRTVEAYAKGLEERLEAVTRANKLREQNAFAASIIQDQNAMLQASGHDTRQVLLAINTATDVLERKNGSNDQDLIYTLKASSEYLEDILATTLTAKRTYSSSRNIIALSAFSIEDVLSSLKRIYLPAFQNKGLNLSLEPTENVLVVSDRALLTRALSNFIANSLEATSAGGLEIRAEMNQGWIELSLTDTGSGIAPDLLDYLLSDEDLGGAPDATERPGSGFKIAKSIIAQLDGRLSVETDAASGTQITVALPVAMIDATQITKSVFETETGLSVLDLDRLDQLSPKSNGTVGISFDDSSVMRDRAAGAVELLIYKPLVKELCDHPAIQRLKSDL